jgi:hypothetical protein
MSTEQNEQEEGAGVAGHGDDAPIDPVPDAGPFTAINDDARNSLPPVSRDSLLLCMRFLSDKLTFPFEALYSPAAPGGSVLPGDVLVLGLVEPGENWRQDGILCRAIRQGETIEFPLKDILIRGESGERSLVEGYAQWFRENQSSPAELIPFRQRIFTYSTQVPVKLPLGMSCLVACSAGALFGFLLGSLLGAVQLARICACLSAGLFGLLGVWGTVRMRALTASTPHSSFRRLSAVLYIGLIAACLGGLAGAMLVGFIGIFCGAVAGGILGRFIAGGLRGTGLGILIGSILGPVFLAFYVDRASALYWGLHAAWVGALLGGLVGLLGVHASRR